jgi:hypothetical protein
MEQAIKGCKRRKSRNREGMNDSFEAVTMGRLSIQ